METSTATWQVPGHTFRSATCPLLQAAPRGRGTTPDPHPRSTCPASSGLLPQVTGYASVAFWLQVEDSRVRASDPPTGAALCPLWGVSVVSTLLSRSPASDTLGRPGRSAHH